MIRITTITTIALTLATPALAQERIISGIRLDQSEAQAQAMFQGQAMRFVEVRRERP